MVLSRDPGRRSLAMSLLTSYHGTLGEPLPSPGLSFSTGQARRQEERNDISIPYISKEIISYVRPEAQLPGNILEGADSWGQCWPRPR